MDIPAQLRDKELTLHIQQAASKHASEGEGLHTVQTPKTHTKIFY